jgi:hypothetical protein
MQEWKRNGLLIGALFYILTIVVFPVLAGEKLSVFKVFFGIPLWIVTGMAAAYLLKDRKKSKGRATARKKR